MTNPSEGALASLLDLPAVTFHMIAKQRSIAVVAIDGKLGWASGRYKYEALAAALKAEPVDIGASFKVKLHDEWDGHVTAVLVTDEGRVVYGSGPSGEDAMKSLMTKLAPEPADAAEDKPDGKKAKGSKKADAASGS